MGLLTPAKDLGELEEEDEKVSSELSIEQKKSLIREAKKRYGGDWKLHLPAVKSGLDWDSLKFRLH